MFSVNISCAQQSEGTLLIWRVGPESQPELGAPRFETTERTFPFYVQHSLYLRSEMVKASDTAPLRGGGGGAAPP